MWRRLTIDNIIVTKNEEAILKTVGAGLFTDRQTDTQTHTQTHRQTDMAGGLVGILLVGFHRLARQTSLLAYAHMVSPTMCRQVPFCLMVIYAPSGGSERGGG